MTVAHWCKTPPLQHAATQLGGQQTRLPTAMPCLPLHAHPAVPSFPPGMPPQHACHISRLRLTWPPTWQTWPSSSPWSWGRSPPPAWSPHTPPRLQGRRNSTEGSRQGVSRRAQEGAPSFNALRGKQYSTPGSRPAAARSRPARSTLPQLPPCPFRSPGRHAHWSGFAAPPGGRPPKLPFAPTLPPSPHSPEWMCSTAL